MEGLLKQSTTYTFRIGPFVDDGDGTTEETGLSLGQSDLKLSKAGGAFAQTSDSSPTTTHDEDGWYQCPLTATDTDTLGQLTIKIHKTGALPVYKDFTVVTAAVYDSLINNTGVGIKGSSPQVLVSTTINGAPTSNTQFILAAGSPDDNAYNKKMVIITDQTTSTQKSVGYCSDYTGSTKELFLASDPGHFTFASGDLVEIIGVPSRLDLVDTCTNNTDMITEATVNQACDLALTDYDGPTDAEMDAQFGQLNNLNTTDVLTQANQALVDKGLDRLFVTAYNPDAQPGIATGLLNTLIVSDGGTPQFSTNSLELAPSGGSGADYLLLQTTTITGLASQTVFNLVAGSTDDDVYNNQIAIITDQSTAPQKAVTRVADYVGATKTVPLEGAPGWTIANGDTVDIMALSSVTKAEIATEITTGLATLDDLDSTATASAVTTALTSYGASTGAEVTAAKDKALMVSTTITGLASQTSFKLSAGSSDDDAYNNRTVVITDASTATQQAVGEVKDYTGSDKTITLKEDPGIFTMANGDTIDILATVNLDKLVTSFNNVNAVVNTPVGTVSGFPEELTEGDAYTTANGRNIKIYFKDAAGDTITTFGTKSPADSDFTWSMPFVAEATPEGSPVVTITGDENDWDVTDPAEPFLNVQLTSTDTDLLTVDSGDKTKRYLWQIVLQWGGDDTYEVTGVTKETAVVRRKLA